MCAGTATYTVVTKNSNLKACCHLFFIPHRRTYQSLMSMRNIGESIATQIVLGRACMTNSGMLYINSAILLVLSALYFIAEYKITGLSDHELSIGTSVWPLRQKKGRTGRVKLNKYQKQAISLACNNQFTMIQGPPGKISRSSGLCVHTLTTIHSTTVHCST